LSPPSIKPLTGEEEMFAFRRWNVGVVCLLLAACGSSQSVVKQMDTSATVASKFHIDAIEDHSGQAIPSHIIGAVRGYLESDLTKRNLLAPQGDPAPVVHVDINSYRMRSGFSRAFWGMMAGKDGMGSKVTVLDRPGGRVLGESNVSSFNVSAIGSEDDIARMHADEITKFLAGEKK
jgi:Domain of unknown function (DUF4410)